MCGAKPCASTQSRDAALSPASLSGTISLNLDSPTTKHTRTDSADAEDALGFFGDSLLTLFEDRKGVV